MIDNIFSNKTNILILRFLSRFDNQFFLPEEIAKETGAGLRNVHDALRILSYGQILTKDRKPSGKVHYKFVIDSHVKELIHQLFTEERKRMLLKNFKFYKIISEIESKIVKISGSGLIEIILFGSVAKGRDTFDSDIDLCVLMSKKDDNVDRKIKRVALDSKFPNDIQIHTFTLDDFITGRKNKNPLVENIFRDGIFLRIGK